MKYLYKYPQAAFPYDNLRRDQQETQPYRSSSTSLLDTGVFDEDRYFDVFVEYAKESAGGHPDSRSACPQPRAGIGNGFTCCRRSGSATTWSWGDDWRKSGHRCKRSPAHHAAVVKAKRSRAGRALPLLRAARPQLLFTENETNAQRLFGQFRTGRPTSRTVPQLYCGSHGKREAVNPEKTGTKAAAHYDITVGAGQMR